MSIRSLLLVPMTEAQLRAVHATLRPVVYGNFPRGTDAERAAFRALLGAYRKIDDRLLHLAFKKLAKRNRAATAAKGAK